MGRELRVVMKLVCLIDIWGWGSGGSICFFLLIGGLLLNIVIYYEYIDSKML